MATINKQKFELTEEGLENLKEELHILKNVKRVENLEDIKEARAQGDLSENADYDAARNEQAKIEARIKEIEIILKNAKIIHSASGDSVNIGKEVVLNFLEKKVKRTLKLVGTIEANPMEGKLSIESPLGKAIKNHVKGDTVIVHSETKKSFEVKIEEVRDAAK